MEVDDPKPTSFIKSPGKKKVDPSSLSYVSSIWETDDPDGEAKKGPCSEESTASQSSSDGYDIGNPKDMMELIEEVKITNRKNLAMFHEYIFGDQVDEQLATVPLRMKLIAAAMRLLLSASQFDEDTVKEKIKLFSPAKSNNPVEFSDVELSRILAMCEKQSFSKEEIQLCQLVQDTIMTPKVRCLIFLLLCYYHTTFRKNLWQREFGLN